jgi:hypothetical protein
LARVRTFRSTICTIKACCFFRLVSISKAVPAFFFHLYDTSGVLTKDYIRLIGMITKVISPAAEKQLNQADAAYWVKRD